MTCEGVSEWRNDEVKITPTFASGPSSEVDRLATIPVRVRHMVILDSAPEKRVGFAVAGRNMSGGEV